MSADVIAFKREEGALSPSCILFAAPSTHRVEHCVNVPQINIVLSFILGSHELSYLHLHFGAQCGAVCPCKSIWVHKGPDRILFFSLYRKIEIPTLKN